MVLRVLASLSLLIFLGAHLSFAANSAASLPECSRIASACESQGYKAGQHSKSGKGLWIDCIGVIAKGKTVPGVSGFTADEAKACERAAKALQQQKKGTKGSTAPAGR